MQVPKVFAPLFDEDKENYILTSGRTGGKTKNVSILVGISAAQKPKEDIVIARASSSSIRDSSYNEMVQVFSDIEQLNNILNYKTSPCRIERKDGGTCIYFIGIGGSKERTKGIHPLHPVSIVIIEEAQELKSEEHLDQTMASLRRNFGVHCKVVVNFNPPQNPNHWINKWKERKKLDLDFCVIESSWQDVSMFLKDRDIKEILKIKKTNKAYYDYIYGGIPNAQGGIYPMFYKEKHIITPQQFEKLRTMGIRPVLCIMSGDGAVTHDATAFNCKLIMNNGCAVNCYPFYHDPQVDGQLSSHQLVSQYLTKWFDEVCSTFTLGTIAEMYEAQRRGIRINLIPIYMRIDSAAADLIRECQFYFSHRANVAAINKKTILEMVGTCQNALGSDNEYFLEEGRYKSYVRNRWIERDRSVLVEQITSLEWDEHQTKYNDEIPNDMCDAWTYGTFFWYKNTENLHNFDIFKANCINQRKICDILSSENSQ